MLFWKRKEVYHGFSLKEFSDLKETLGANGIKYDYRILNHNNKGGRGKIGSFGLNPKFDYEYYLYVHKDFLEKTNHLLHK
jgi:hypothetical protein